MAILAVSDVVWQAAIAAFVTVAIAYMQQRTKAAVDKNAEKAAGKVEEVKETLILTTNNVDKKLDGLVQTTDAVHTLVNSAMGAQKRLLAVTARAKADLSNNRIDIEAAEQAEKDLREHETKQRTVDATDVQSGT